MASRELIYRITLSTSDAKRQARNVRQAFENELRTITLGKIDTSAIKTAVSDARQLRLEFEKAAQAAQRAGQSAGGITAPTLGGAGGFFGGQIDDAMNQLKGLVTGYLGVQGVISGINEAIDLSKLNTQAQRANKSFDILSGGAEKSAVNLLAIQQAAGGAVTSLDAIAVGNQAASLGLAKTTQGFEDLARAARLITIVSPIIREQGEALTQLALFSSNAASYARADQLGLSATEVRQRISELRAENENLDDSQLKLLASTQLLDEKFGALLNTTEAQASGLERLTANYQEFRIAIASGTGVVDQFASSLAGGFSQATTYIAGTDTPLSTLINNLRETEKVSRAISELNPLKDILPETLLGLDVNADAIAKDIMTGIASGLNQLPGGSFFPDNLFGLDTGTILGDPDKLAQVSTALQMAIGAVEGGVPGAEEYLNKVTAIAVEVDKQNFATAEQAALVGQLTAAYTAAAAAGGEFVAQQQQQAAAAKATEEARLAAIYDQQALVNQALAGRAAKAAPAVGIEAAIQLYRDQKIAAEQAINQLAATGVASAEELSIRTADIVDGLLAPFDELEAKASAIDLGQLTAQAYELNTAMSGFDAGFIDALPGLSSMRDELLGLSDELAIGAALSAEQAAELDYLAAAAAAVSGTTSGLAAVVSSLGIEFLFTNENAAATVDQMFQAEIAFANGQISADVYAGIISVLSGRLLTLAGDAGVATAAISALNAAQAGKASIGGLNVGQGVAQRLDVQEGIRAREAQRREADRLAAQSARATQRGFTDAAKATERAFKEAARELESDLKSVPGLFGRSQVTAEQMSMADMGIAQNFADDFLRRAEDEFKNGVDWPEVNLADIAKRVGLDPGLPAEQIFNELVQQWESGALFADKANLELINQDAVKKALELKEKARQGQENILEFFGAQVDRAVEAVTGASGAAGGAGGAITIDAGAVAQSAALALTPTIDTASIQTQLDALVAPSLAVGLTVDATLAQTAIDALTPPRLSVDVGLYSSPTSLSEFVVAVGENMPAITAPVQLYTSIEEIQLFNDTTKTTVTPVVDVALALAEDAVTPFITALNTQIRGSTEGIKREGATVAQILIAGMIAHFQAGQAASGGGEGGEGGGTPFADALMTNLSTQFTNTSNMFYAVGFIPAGHVEDGFKAYAYDDLSGGVLEGFTAGLRATAGDWQQRGGTIGGYVQQGITESFKTDYAAQFAVAAGATWGSAFMQGALSTIAGGALVQAITAQVAEDIAGELEQP